MDMTVNPADKGSIVVMLSKDDYIREADQQLNNESYYQKLIVDPRSQQMSEAKKFVDSIFNRGVIYKRFDIS